MSVCVCVCVSVCPTGVPVCAVCVREMDESAVHSTAALHIVEGLSVEACPAIISCSLVIGHSTLQTVTVGKVERDRWLVGR